jgi:hypothetical protein
MHWDALVLPTFLLVSLNVLRLEQPELLMMPIAAMLGCMAIRRERCSCDANALADELSS